MMIANTKKYILIAVIILVGFASCNTNKESKPLVPSNINLDHFDHLYKTIDFKGKKAAIIHIYSEYPDYDFEIEPNEGFTCVDDVARAMVMLSKYLKTHGNDDQVYDKLKRLTEFVLQMQNDNGYFNNFIWNDLSINTTYKTSVAELNWWSFRALWGLESAYESLSPDKDLTGRIEVATERLLMNIKRDLPITNFKTEYIEKIEVPTWLPQKYASDQSALLILGLLKNQERTSDKDIKPLIDALAKGIMLMQKGDANTYPYGAFMSWQNLWHAWGNNQAYALLKAGQRYNESSYIESALKEIDNFYPYMLEHGFAEAIWIQKEADGSGFSEVTRNSYPQIAYGLRPMVWATTEAYSYSKNKKYKTLAKALEAWLYGENDAKGAMYDPSTGICFDGIKSKEDISKNSGAESTIESLLILLELEKLKQE